MADTVKRALQILGGGVKSAFSPYAENLISLANDADTIRNNVMKVGKDARDTYARMKGDGFTKKFTDWFYNAGADYEDFDLGGADGDDFDPGFDSDDESDDNEPAAAVLDSSSMRDIAKGQVNAMFKIGGKQADLSVANTAEIVTSINTRSSELTAAVNNLGVGIQDISRKLDQLIKIQSDGGPSSPSSMNSGTSPFDSSGKLSLEGIWNSAKNGASNKLGILGSVASMAGGITPDMLLGSVLSRTIGNKKFDKLGGKSIDDIGKTINDSIGAAVQNGLSSLIESDKFKKLFGDITSTKADQDYAKMRANNYNTDKAVFDGMVRTSIVETIPEYLKKIAEGVTGQTYNINSRGELTTKNVDNWYKVTEKSFSSSGLKDGFLNKMVDTGRGLNVEIGRQDMKDVYEALMMTYAISMAATGKTNLPPSAVDPNDFSVIAETAKTLEMTTGKSSAECQQMVYVVLSMLANDTIALADFRNGVTKSTKNMIDEATKRAKSDRNARRITMDLGRQAFVERKSGSYANTTLDGDKGSTPSAKVDSVGITTKNAEMKYSMYDYTKGIFGILNRGLNVYVTNQKGSYGSMDKAYEGYQLTKDPESVTNATAVANQIASALDDPDKSFMEHMKDAMMPKGVRLGIQYFAKAKERWNDTDEEGNPVDPEKKQTTMDKIIGKAKQATKPLQGTLQPLKETVSGIGDKIKSEVSAIGQDAKAVAGKLNPVNAINDRLISNDVNEIKHHVDTSDSVSEQDKLLAQTVLSMMQTSTADGDSSDDIDAINKKISEIKDPTLRQRLNNAVVPMLNRNSKKSTNIEPKSKTGSLISKLLAGVGLIFKPIKSVISKGFGAIKSIGSKIFDLIKKGISSGVNDVKRGSKAIKEGLFGVKEQKDDNGNIIQEGQTGLLQDIFGSRKKKKKEETKDGDDSENKKSKKDRDFFGNFKKQWNDLVGSSKNKKDSAEKPTRSENQEEDEKENKGLIGKAKDKAKDLKNRFEQTEFGAGFMSVFKKEDNKKNLKPESFADNKINDIYTMFTEGTGSFLTRVNEMLTGIHDKLVENPDGGDGNDGNNDDADNNNNNNNNNIDPNAQGTQNNNQGQTTGTGLGDALQGQTQTSPDGGGTGGTGTTGDAAPAAGGEGGGSGAAGALGKLGKLGKVIGGIASAVMGIFKIVMTIVSSLAAFQTLTNLVKKMYTRAIKPLNKVIKKFMVMVKGVLKTVSDLLKKAFEVIADVLTKVLTSLQPIMDLVQTLVDMIFTFLDPILDILGTVIDTLLDILMPIMDLIIDLLEPILDLLTPLFDTISAIFDVLLPLIEIITAVINAIIVPLSGVLTYVLMPIIKTISYDLEIVMGVVQLGFGIIITALGGILTAVGSILKFFGGGSSIRDKGEEMLNMGTGMITNGITSIVDGTKHLMSFDRFKVDTEEDEEEPTQTVRPTKSAENVTGGSIMDGVYASGNTSQKSYGSFMNMGDRGCGPIALADAASMRSGSKTDARALAMSMAGAGTYDPSRGTSVGDFVRASRSMGLGASVGGVTQASLKQASPTNPITVVGSGSEFGTKNGNNHFMNVIGTDGHGGAYVSNPLTGRTDRRSLSSVAGSSLVGIYGSGDTSNTYTFPDAISEAMEELKELAGKLLGLFTGDSAADEMVAEMDKAKNQNAIDEAKAQLGDEKYAEYLEKAKDLARDDYEKQYPKKDSETDEQYEAAFEKWWSSKADQAKYLAKAGLTDEASKSYSDAVQAMAKNSKDLAANMYGEPDENGNYTGNGGFVDSMKQAFAEADQYSYGSSGSSSGSSGSDPEGFIRSTAMIAKAGRDLSYDKTYSQPVTLTLDDGSVLQNVYRDCSGLISAAIRNMGYDIGGSRFTTYNFANGTNSVIKDSDGNPSKDWDVALFDKNDKRMGDIPIIPEGGHAHMGMYLKSGRGGSYDYGFDWGSDQGFEQSGEAAEYYLNGDSNWLTKLKRVTLSENDTTPDGWPSAEYRLRYIGGLTGGTYEEQIWNYLTSNGASKMAAAGFMGNFAVESNNQPNRLEGDYALGSYAEQAFASPSKMNDYTINQLFPYYDRTGIGYDPTGYKADDGKYYPGIGLAQWTGPRAKGIAEYATRKNVPLKDLSTQLNHWKDDMEGSYKSVLTAANSATSVEAAAQAVFSKYEGPRDSSLGTRQSEAKRIYELYKDWEPGSFGTSNYSYDGSIQSNSDAYFAGVLTDDYKNQTGGTSQEISGEQGPDLDLLAKQIALKNTIEEKYNKNTIGNGFGSLTVRDAIFRDYLTAFNKPDSLYIHGSKARDGSAGWHAIPLVAYSGAPGGAYEYTKTRNIVYSDASSKYNEKTLKKALLQIPDKTLGTDETKLAKNLVDENTTDNAVFDYLLDSYIGRTRPAIYGGKDANASNNFITQDIDTVHASITKFTDMNSKTANKGLVGYNITMNDKTASDSALTTAKGIPKVYSEGFNQVSRMMRATASGDTSSPYWFNSLFGDSIETANISNDVPDIDTSKLLQAAYETQDYQSASNPIIVNKYSSDNEAYFREREEKFLSNTYNIRSERIEDLLQKIIEIIEDDDPTHPRPGSGGNNQSTNTGTTPRLFNDDRIPTSVQRLSKG